MTVERECSCPGCVRARYARVELSQALKSWARVRGRGWSREVMHLDRVQRRMGWLATVLATEPCRGRALSG